MNIELRDYQLQTYSMITDSLKKGEKKLMVVKPPGAGKGTFIAWLLWRMQARGNRGLFIVHKRDLIISENGLGDRLEKQFNFYDYGYYLAGMPKSERPIMMGTVQTMSRRKATGGKFSVVIIDECHRIKMNTYQKLMKRFPDAIIIGFTATPFRGDKKGFVDDFDVLIHPIKYNGLVKRKALVPTKVIAPVLAPDVTSVKTRGDSNGFKDFVDDELVKLYDDERVYTGVVEKYKQYAMGMKTIVFNCNSKQHSRRMAQYFVDAGVSCKAIDSDTPLEERNQLLTDFKNDKFDVLCNIALFTEGISIDDVKCIVFNVATTSPTKWVQGAARGSRPIFNSDYSDWLKGPDGNYIKKECLILDFGGNAERHGYIDDYDSFGFTLAGDPPKMGDVATKTCPECELVVYAQTRVCPECGYVFPIKPKEDKVYADEVEWKELERIKVFHKRFSEMPYNQIEKNLKDGAFGAEMLRIIAKANGYRSTWAIYQAIALGVVPPNLNPKLTSKNIPKAMSILESLEKKAGVHSLYNRMKKMK